MKFKALQGKLQMQLAPDYFTALRYAKSTQDLASAVHLHFKKALELVMPDHDLIIKPQKDP
jgi:hypothetical protein